MQLKIKDDSPYEPSSLINTPFSFFFLGGGGWWGGGGQILNLSTLPSFKIHSTWTTKSFHPTSASLLSRYSLHLTSARPKLGGKGLADEGNTRVAGAGGGCRAGPTGNRERGGGAGGGAGGREPKFTTGSCESTTGRSICNKNPGSPLGQEGTWGNSNRQAQEWRSQIPAEQGPLREGSHSDHQAAEEWSRNLTGMGGPGVPVGRQGGKVTPRL